MLPAMAEPPLRNTSPTRIGRMEVQKVSMPKKLFLSYDV